MWNDNTSPQSDKNWRNLPISNPKTDLHNINAYSNFGKNHVDIYSSYHLDTKYGWTYDNQKLVKLAH